MLRNLLNIRNVMHANLCPQPPPVGTEVRSRGAWKRILGRARSFASESARDMRPASLDVSPRQEEPDIRLFPDEGVVRAGASVRA